MMSTHKVNVEFKITAPESNQAFLAGSFNDWSPTSDPMKKDKSGVWKKAKKLHPGTYQYKFIVDDVWLLDPLGAETVSNEHGTANNVVHVTAANASTAKREAYIAKIMAKLEKWNNEIDKLEAKAEQAKDASKAKYRRQIESLRSMRAEFEKKLEDLAQSGGKAWEELRGGVESAWKSLSKNIKAAISKFK